eukprot:SM000048S16603  [mRNA]  locus=s48:588655:592233:- [translate_table: standard]
MRVSTEGRKRKTLGAAANSRELSILCTHLAPLVAGQRCTVQMPALSGRSSPLHLGSGASMAPLDPHSYADGDQPLTESVELRLRVDFEARAIAGTATLRLAAPARGALDLDTRGLEIEAVAASPSGAPLEYELGQPDVIKGRRLHIKLEGDAVAVRYRTTAASTALQWLAPPQTAGGVLPYVFTQCQAIHARSVFPCQDTPLARIKYTADVEVMAAARVVMSAAHVGRTTSVDGNTIIESFRMEQPIPPYLFALAAGDIKHQDLSHRCRVYAEPAILQAAAYEFADVERMVEIAEQLFGPYDWERFDVLVMPPSFPFGGMENPRMVFLTPTLLAGDRSLVGVVAHELAHSWTGNLVTNATMDDFWLNEGFTTYAERRIQEALEGPDRLAMHSTIGWNGLVEEVRRFKDQPQFTRLKMNLEGIDPDEVYSEVPYEKGFLFLKRIENEVGRPRFDAFLRKYISAFRFQSITTETFLAFLSAELPGIGDAVDLHEWVQGTGIPSDAPRPASAALEHIKALAEGGQELTAEDTAAWQALDWQVYLEALPRVLNHDRVARLNERFHLSESTNSEIRSAFLTIVAHSEYKSCYQAIERSLASNGRMKYLKSLYTGLLQGAAESKAFSRRVFEDNKLRYHPIAKDVIEGVLSRNGA